ncbi:hypothetical protein BwSF21_14800 [Bradyrhizobium ottawaense]|nr:hypothetical protein BwSF21_14800 [Bradyrhizobium ottawaense]
MYVRASISLGFLASLQRHFSRTAYRSSLMYLAAQLPDEKGMTAEPLMNVGDHVRSEIQAHKIA